MFRTPNVKMLLAKATLKIIQDDKKVDHRMAECALVIEPLPRSLALELGDDVAVHLFTDDGAIRSDLESVSLDPRIPQQAVSVREVPDMDPVVILRNVDITAFVASRQQDEKSGDEWIKATVRARFSLAERSHRDFLARYFGFYLLWDFELEQRPLSDVAQDFVDANRKIMGPGGSVTFSSTDAKGKRRGVRITQDAIEPLGGTQ